MTRSGVFNSVHSFTQSPIGPIFLAFLAVTIVFSVVLLSARMHLLEDEGKIAALMSREAAFLLNNVVFVVFTFTVLLGNCFSLGHRGDQRRQDQRRRAVFRSNGRSYWSRLGLSHGDWPYPALGTSRHETGQGSHDITGNRCDRRSRPRDITRTQALLWTLATFAGCGFAATATLRDMWKPIADRRQRRQEGILTGCTSCAQRESPPLRWLRDPYRRDRHYRGHRRQPCLQDFGRSISRSR